MKLHGLQKMTLLDFPGHVACTVFLGGCDFRCPFCHNFELVDGSWPPQMDDEAFFSFLKKRQGLLDGVAITGGEPCLYRDLPDFMRRIRSLGFAVKLDTNGNHPELLETILAEGLADYVAMDIKNSPAKYAATIGLPDTPFDTAAVSRSIALLMNSGIEYEFRTTVVEGFHEQADFERIGQWIAGAKHYYLQAFTDRDSVPFGGLAAPSREAMEQFAETARQYLPDVQIRGMD